MNFRIFEICAIKRVYIYTNVLNLITINRISPQPLPLHTGERGE